MLNPDLTYNLSAIMQAALVYASHEHAALRRQFPGQKRQGARAMSYGLKQFWQDARGARMNAEQKIQLAAEAALLSTKQCAPADLKEALAGADYIDSTRRCFATKTAFNRRSTSCAPNTTA